MSLPVTAHAAKPTAVFRGDAQDFRENVQLSVQSAKTKLKLNKSAATILVGEKITLKATVTGKKGTVKWSSSKKSVVTVRSKGVATGKKKETATITAKVNGVRNCAPSGLFKRLIRIHCAGGLRERSWEEAVERARTPFLRTSYAI